MKQSDCMTDPELEREMDDVLDELERNGEVEVDRSDPSNPRYRLTEKGMTAARRVVLEVTS